MSIYDPIRITLTVKSWDIETKTGVVTDRNHFDFEVTEKDLSPDALGYLCPGEQVAALAAGLSVRDLAPFERPQMASVGPAPEVVAWEPKTGDPNYYCAGRATDAKAHDGKFSTGFEPARKSPEEAGLDRLDEILTERIEELSLQQRRIMEKTEKKDDPTT